MNNFITRVDLHQSGPEDYIELNRQMAEKGFSPTLAFEPCAAPDPAEYRLSSALTRSQVLDLAAQAAASVKPHYMVRVANPHGVALLVRLPPSA